MGEDELPDIYLADDNPVENEPEEYAGRGARERKVTRYDDGLTEEQWLMAVDADDDTIEDAIARKEAKIERRRQNREKRGRKGGPDSSPDRSRESSETPQPKKRRKGPVPKRKAEELVEETPPAKRKKGKQSNRPTDNLSGVERATLQKILNNVYQALIELEQEIPADSSDSEDEPVARSIIEPFMKPPPKSQYPDYYMIIQNPIAMDIIKKKINREEYPNLKEFYDDVHLLCQNARTYNEDGSILFQDANDIESTCITELKRQTQDHPELADFDDPGSSAADGLSTTAVSGAGTPASSGHPKLKLTFNGNSNKHGVGITNGAVSGTVSDEE
jgi:ATP-dependent helicase STH1/SNF2